MSLLCSTDTLREEADCISCDGYVTTGRRLEDAADEIDQLRAENEKLREQNRYLMKGDLLHVLTDQELAEQQRREREMQASIKALDAENAKLRELVRDFYPFALGRAAKPWLAVRLDRMRELGVEV